MRTYGCDACGAVVELPGSQNKNPDGWGTARLVRYGHKPVTYLLCPSCSGDIEHLLTGTRRGQTRIHTHAEPQIVEGSQ